MSFFKERRDPFGAPNFDVFAPARLQDERGIIESQVVLDKVLAYTPWIGLSTVRELALEHADRVGLVDADIVDELKERVTDLSDEVDVLRAKVEANEAFKANIAGLKAEGFDVSKRKGPARRPEGAAA